MTTVGMMASNVSVRSCIICCIHVGSTSKTPRKMSKHGSLTAACSVQFVLTPTLPFRHFCPSSFFVRERLRKKNFLTRENFLEFSGALRERKLAKEHEGVSGTRRSGCKSVWNMGM